MDRFEIVHRYLEKSRCDAWVLVDYENRNPIVVSFVGQKMLTRKIIMVLPKDEKPYIICHSIDTVFLKDPEILEHFDLHVYNTWKEMLALEKADMEAYRTIAMDVSENGLLPRVSLADWGSVSYLQNLGKTIISSGDIQAQFAAVFDEEAAMSQKLACEKSLQIKDEAFALIRQDILEKGESDEYRIQKFICDRYHEEGMIYDDPAIVAIGPNASNPHYGPTEDVHSPIHEGDVVLIDMWAKFDKPGAVYSDITWMGYVGKEVPEAVEARFEILREAVDQAFRFLEVNLPSRRVEGYEVDDVSRKVIQDSGYGDYFTHRTGHNINGDVSPHGPGVNIDDYESHDTREIVPNISFSLEPGIYAPDFGMRSETDVYIDASRKPHRVGGRQDKVIAILK